jgi:hypothetical protein
MRRSSSVNSLNPLKRKTRKIQELGVKDRSALRLNLFNPKHVTVASTTKSVALGPGTTKLSSVAMNDRTTPDAPQASSRPPYHLSSQSWPITSNAAASFLPGSGAPLTPPEDIDSFKWDAQVSIEQPEHSQGVKQASSTQPGRTDGQSAQHSRPSSTARPSGIQIPETLDLTTEDTSMPNWLQRACRPLVSHLGDSSNQQHIQMVVQALPSQAKTLDVKPVFEKVVEVVQAQYSYAPYITITHAVSQVIGMDEVPASPPATPNTHNSGDDYFQDQTIFTHAAMVPAYHTSAQSSVMVAPRPTNIIAAPSSVHITTLERYIPPTTKQEVNDFFNLTRKSYLADRLRELSVNNGSLLLIYPTKKGATTFANKYIGPIIEPFLRQFILLNNLYTELAATLGHMSSLEAMKTFEECTAAISAMCQALDQRAPVRGLQSRFNIVHAETANVVLSDNVWKEWFLEQEQPRLRQNLIDYHKAGGRMPGRTGQIEVTPGMLAREVLDGIRTSRELAGNQGIEVGVFVIRRSLV